MAKQNSQYVPVTGRNIYVDDRDRTIYYNKKTKIGYVITQDKAPGYRTYAYRWGAGIGVIALFIAFELPLPLSIIFGLAVSLVLDYRFKHSYLEGLTQIRNFKPKEKMSYIETLAQEDEKKIILKVVLYVALAILLPLNSIQQKHDTLIFVIVSLVGIGCLVMAVNQVRALLFKKK